MKASSFASAAAIACLMAAPAFAATNPSPQSSSLPATTTAAAATPPATGVTPTTPPATGGAAGQAAMTQTQASQSNFAESGGYTGDQLLIQKDLNKNNNGNNDKNAGMPAKMNPLLADNGDARASKVIGTDVYNAQDQNLGSVDDILIGKNGLFAVINGPDHKVAVPFAELQFGNANVDGNEKAVIPAMTKAELNRLPQVNYNAANNNGGVLAGGNGNNSGAGNNNNGNGHNG